MNSRPNCNNNDNVKRQHDTYTHPYTSTYTLNILMLLFCSFCQHTEKFIIITIRQEGSMSVMQLCLGTTMYHCYCCFNILLMKRHYVRELALRAHILIVSITSVLLRLRRFIILHSNSECKKGRHTNASLEQEARLQQNVYSQLHCIILYYIYKI